jgi:hypothetical protein
MEVMSMVWDDTFDINYKLRDMLRHGRLPMVNESEIIGWINGAANRIVAWIQESESLYSKSTPTEGLDIWDNPKFLRMLDKAIRYFIEMYMDIIRKRSVDGIVIVKVDVADLFGEDEHFGRLRPFDIRELEQILIEELERVVEEKYFQSKE